MSASDAPVRERGTRARSGNAMARTRSALLEATGECLASYGIRKTTMVDVASRSRVAKATLYNHFRTKDDLLVAYVEDRVAALGRTAVTTASATGLAAALQELAAHLAADAALRRAAAEEPALLAPLLTPSAGRGWELARTAASDVLTAARASTAAADVQLLLRWATSQLLWPAVPDPSVEAVVRAVCTGPAPAAAPVPAPTPTGEPAVGWPGD